ncbi:hypothetical protein LZ30DRAFT_177173 [Colletotrichum cereale]|nr:hypothetical protein LZ30DRAFT_177173 [Colletotrichum cereale]
MSQTHAQRHTACKSCRDKKVRCDGDQPSCSKCLRSGDQCLYMPIPTPTRATLANMVNEMQQRLERAEARLPPVQQHQQQQQSHQSPFEDPQVGTATLSPPAFSIATMGTPAQPMANNPKQPQPQPGQPGTVSSRSPLAPSSIEYDGACFDPSSFQMLLYESQHASDNSGLDPDMAEQASRHAEGSHNHMHSHLPSISELRSIALGLGGGNANGDGGRSSTTSSSSGSGSSGINGSGPPAALRPVTDFVLGAAAAQAEASAHLGVIAEYLAWAIMLPDTGRRSAEILKILEARLQEIKQAAGLSMLQSYQRLCLSFENVPEWFGPLQKLEASIQESRIRAKGFFEKDYNVYLPLTAQQQDCKAWRIEQ